MHLYVQLWDFHMSVHMLVMNGRKAWIAEGLMFFTFFLFPAQHSHKSAGGGSETVVNMDMRSI